MFTPRETDYLAAWCRDLSFGDYTSADHKLLRAHVAVSLAAAIANIHPRFDEARFVDDCGVDRKDLS